MSFPPTLELHGGDNTSTLSETPIVKTESTQGSLSLGLVDGGSKGGQTGGGSASDVSWTSAKSAEQLFLLLVRQSTRSFVETISPVETDKLTDIIILQVSVLISLFSLDEF